MTSNQHRKEAFGAYSNIPQHMFTVNRVDTGDSGYLTDPTHRYNTISEHSQLPSTLQETLFHSPNQSVDFVASPPPREKSNPALSSSPTRFKKDKPHKCNMCAENRAFTTKNDLDRHLKSRHGIYKKGDKLWYCPVQGCSTAGKKWPRLDNFLHHLYTQHGIKTRHSDSFETVKEEQCRSDNHFTPTRIKSPPMIIDPQLLDDASQLPWNFDVVSVGPDRSTYMPHSSVIIRYSPASETKSAVRQTHCYPYRPALTPSAKAVNNEVVSTQSKSPPSSAPRKAQLAAALSIIEHVQSPDVGVHGDSPTSSPWQFQSHIPLSTMLGDSRGSKHSFIDYWDAQRAQEDESPDILTGIGSFDCLTPSLMNTDSTRTSDGTLRDCMDCSLPGVDFQIIPDFCKCQRLSTRDPIPQLQITPSQEPEILSQSTNTQASNSPGEVPRHDGASRLMPPHDYSPDTVFSSPLTEGEELFVHYEATHDPDLRYNPATAAFIETLARVLIELASQTPSSSNETTRPGTGGGRSTTASAQPQQNNRGNKNKGNNKRKRAADDSSGSGRRANGDDEQEEDNQNPEESSNNKRTCKDQGLIWACPYYKRNPSKYRECSGVVCRSISIIKQHLIRKHSRPQHYCARCFVEFKTHESLQEHLRRDGDDRCSNLEDPYQDRMTLESQGTIQRRPGADRALSEQWYDIYETLFPDERIPDTPFLDDTETVMHILNILGLIPEAMQLMVRRRDQILPASREVLDQVITRYSELYPQVQMGVPLSQQPLPMMMMPSGRLPRTPAQSRSGMNANHLTQQSIPNYFPSYNQTPFPQIDTPTPSIEMNNQPQIPQNPYQGQPHQLQHQSPPPLSDQNQRNAVDWRAAAVAYSGSWAQGSQ